MKIMLDTCIVVDVLQDRLPFSKTAKTIFLLIANKQIEGFISAKAITDIYYLTHRATHNDKKTREILKTLLDIFSVLDTTAIDCRKAISSNIKDYEDGVMCETAERCGIDFIITRNKKDFVSSNIEILSPDEFICMLENSEKN